ncbi:TetR-like C-terminal domain-containing protein [Synechococcus sp. PCC 7335]|uniref:TetR-like C-terminal domain-containing protein n=1 Tax=Synechococcus sp. (strain ATCC 29403 / PCC 7335) TaxID=91464 RepID=UPI00057209A6|nr:TetR-like C-terminal domain-containing protein [Synechococcus sp. PCC 7335]
MAKKQSYHHGDLRQALVSAALALLQKKDVQSLSLREVAREAGVSHAAPYRHFEDKAALLAAIAAEGFTKFGEYLQNAVDQTPNQPVESLLATGVAYVRYALDHPIHFRIMFSHYPPNQPIDSSLYEVSTSTFQILVDIIAAGQSAQIIRMDQDAEFLALGKWSLVHGIAMLLLDGMLTTQRDAQLALAESLVRDSLVSLTI